MNVTIVRKHVIWMYEHLSKMNFSHFSTNDLEKLIVNYAAIRQVAESYSKMMAELHRRLFAEVDRKELAAFKAIEEGDPERAFLDNPVIAELFARQKHIGQSLLMKEVTINLEPIDKLAFMRAAILGKADMCQNQLELFYPIFCKESRDDDYAELDEVMIMNE